MHQYRLRERLEHGTVAQPWHLYTLGCIQGTVFPCHWHPEWELVVVERGTLELTRNQSLTRLGEGEVAFVTGTDLHGGTGGPEVKVAAFVFCPGILRPERREDATSSWLDHLEDGRWKVSHPLEATSAAAGLARRLVAAVRRAAPGREFEVKGLLFQFLATLMAEGLLRPTSDAASVDPLPRLRSSLQFIEEHFDRPLSVDDLAQRANFSPSHFARVFKAFTGDTPLQHLIRRRIDEADLLLRRGELSVAEVALRVGFTNFSHFSRTFRTHRGVTPRTVVEGGLDGNRPSL